MEEPSMQMSESAEELRECGSCTAGMRGIFPETWWRGWSFMSFFPSHVPTDLPLASSTNGNFTSKQLADPLPRILQRRSYTRARMMDASTVEASDLWNSQLRWARMVKSFLHASTILAPLRRCCLCHCLTMMVATLTVTLRRVPWDEPWISSDGVELALVTPETPSWLQPCSSYDFAAAES